MDKPYTPSNDQNKEAILEVLKKEILDTDKKLLEIGAGTGQHAVFLAPHFEHLTWHVSDMASTHLGMMMWLKEAKVKNIKGPIRLQIGVDDFPEKDFFQCVFCADILQAISWKKAKTLAKLLGKRLREHARVFFYGPFHIQSVDPSSTHQELDGILKAKDPQSGVRNLEDVEKMMKKNGFVLSKNYKMPQENQMLVFTRLAHKS